MEKEMSDKKFYVYIHLKADDKTPFYIGKGFGDRAFRKISRNKWWTNTVNKHGFDVEFVKQELYENEAFDLETALIKKIGRKDLGLGPLVNLTDGGEGSTGMTFHHTDEAKAKIGVASKKQIVSAETRQKISQAHKGKYVSEDTCKKISKAKSGVKHKNPMSMESRKKLSDIRIGMVYSDETRKKMSDAAKKRTPSDETKRKISDSLKQRKREQRPSLSCPVKI